MSIDQVDLVVFKPQETEEVASNIGLQVERKYLVRAGQRVVCDGCHDEIRVTKFGAALPGSRLYYCDNPACLESYVANRVKRL
jgi:hypothetical protein